MVGNADHVDPNILHVILIVVKTDDAGDAREDADQREMPETEMVTTKAFAFIR